MHSPRWLALVAATMALAACNPFHRAPVSQVTRDANVNARWRASLVTPASLVGAVQINGLASMQPGRNATETQISLSLANATPGGIHPWQVRYGQCGADSGVLGSTEAYAAIKVGDDGRGEATAMVRLTTPTTGRYFVTVSASAANASTIVACGNLAPPAS
jgi:hypothetical protein